MKFKEFLLEKFEQKDIKVEKSNKEVTISYKGNTFYIPLGEFTTIKFESKDGKISTSTSTAFANTKFKKFFTKEGMEYLKSEFKKIKESGEVTGEKVYKHFKG